VKISKHKDTRAHILCTEIIQQRNRKSMEQIVEKMNVAMYEETNKIFRTVYYISKSNRPFIDHEDLLKLQQLNGINVGTILHSRYSATTITDHLATEMRKRMVKHITASNAKLAVLIDESTSATSKSVLTVHLKADVGNDHPIFMFLDLIELQSQTADVIARGLMDCLTSHGFTEEYLQQNWIAFACDGASVMLGRKAGVAQKLLRQFTHLFIWHCLNHRLELAVADSVESMDAVNHVKCFLDTIYSLYSQSPKNQRELTRVCEQLGHQCLSIGRVLGVRWVASSYRTIRALWNSFEALCKHFESSSVDMARDSRDRAKFKGLLVRLRSPQFVCDLALLHDCLSELSSLSLQLQSRNMSLPRADTEIKRSIRILQSFKEEPGEKMQMAQKMQETMTFGCVQLESNTKLKTLCAKQFLQCLIDNMNNRLCSLNSEQNAEVVKALSVLDKTTWPDEIRIRYGEKEVQLLARRFKLDELRAQRGMIAFVDGECNPENLKPLQVAVKTLPCSTAECERDFSLMNLICTDLRTSLTTKNIANLMFLNINGPPLENWQPEEYVKTWLLKHRSAVDTRSRVVQDKNFDDDDRRALWQLF
jgi:hypothetical protein